MKWLSNASVDELADTLIRNYMGDQADKSFIVDIDGFVVDYLKLPLVYQAFAEKDTTTLGFISDGTTPLNVSVNHKRQPKVFPKGTIVIEKCLKTEFESGRRRFTVAHEAAHYIVDKSLTVASFHREFDKEKSYTPDTLKSLFNIKETNVDRLAGALLMPRFMVHRYLLQNDRSDGITLYDNGFIRPEDNAFLQRMAADMGASVTAMQIRLMQLGLYLRKSINEYVTELGLGKETTDID